MIERASMDLALPEACNMVAFCLFISWVSILCDNRYDIPVLHIDDVYWAKHRLTPEEAVEGIEQSCQGRFLARTGEPDASRLEHNS
eukprot:scaffold248425_cov73-Cyclotella_meneghiniana.AAC.4